ncbi:MAG: hypothetical protein L0229_09395 [Blastocatellia bacterium]|nr:hypothetical protein [Blastocatellia bacterium]
MNALCFIIFIRCAAFAGGERNDESKMKPGLKSKRVDQSADGAKWKAVAEIPEFPFKRFAEMQKAVSDRRFNLGVDALAAAEWSEKFNTGLKKSFIAALSILLLVAGLASIVAAVALRNYWLLLAVAIQALAFYVSHPASPLRSWATLGGIASIVVFLDLLFRDLTTAATLTAYAGLTFAAVRAAGFITNSAFRRALLSDETLFLSAYAARACSLQEKGSDRVYAHR